MFFLELLLCRTATLRWCPILPLTPLLLVGVWFLTLAEFHLAAWILFLFWCTPSLFGKSESCYDSLFLSEQEMSEESES